MLKHHKVAAASRAAVVLFFTAFRELYNRFGPDQTLAVKIRAQCFWNDDCAVSLLIIFDYRNPGPTNGEARSIQRVHEPYFLTYARPVSDVSAPGLKIIEVAAR